MAYELITTWGEYQSALDRLLGMARRSICIYDEDLSQIKLESPTRLNELRRLLRESQNNALRIAVRNAAPLRQQSPLLMTLLATYSHAAATQETPATIAHLRDSMILVDDLHALVRFEKDQPRSKILTDDPDALRPYINRFNEIWNEGGEVIANTTLGL